MSVDAPTTAATADPSAEPVRNPLRRWRPHLVMGVLALALAVYVTSGLWHSPYNTTLSENSGDQAFFEWVMAYGVYVLHHGADPFFTSMLNAPLGVNLAANTSVTTYAILFAPLSMLAGPQISFLTVLTLNLAGTAVAWYLFFGRWLTTNRTAAGLGGLFIAFAPGFISHANGHLNWTSGWIAPVVIWRLLLLRQPGRWLRNGVILGVLLALLFTIAGEGLFFTALAGGVFLIAWSTASAVRSEVRAALPTVLAALGVTALVAGTLLAYPLYMHFDGPQTFRGTGFSQRNYAEDIAAYLGYADRSFGAMMGLGGQRSPNPTEQTSFFGLPLVIIILFSFILLWRRAEAGHRATLRAIAAVGVVFFVLSLGPNLQWFGTDTEIELPYTVLGKWPLFDSALPGRYALVVVAVIGIILARTTDVLLSERPFARPNLYTAAITVALVPLFPLPLLTMPRAPELKFIADGTWKRYVPDGGGLTAIPLALNIVADGQRWQAYTMSRGGAQFRIPSGYFLGPDQGGKEGPGRIGVPYLRSFDYLILRAADESIVPDAVTDQDRANIRMDFAYWGVNAVVMPDDSGWITGPHGPLDRDSVEVAARALLGEPEHVEDALVWRIRPGVDPVDGGVPQ